MTDIFEIPLSKSKLVLPLIGSLLFVLIGILFFTNTELFTLEGLLAPVTVRVIGATEIAFFGLGAVLIIMKLFDQKIGLKIDQSGITDNSSLTSVGLIDWEDIEEISADKVVSTKFLVIKTRNPAKYLDRAPNAVARKALKDNHNMCGSPVTIISTSLKIKFDDLEKLLREELRKRKQSEPLEIFDSAENYIYDGNRRKTTA